MNKQITSLSDLHRDIWFEIFTYFYADELFNTFVNISNEINAILLNDFQLRFHIRVDYDLTTKILSQVQPSQISSISIEEMENNDIDIKNMIYLRSILIKGTNTDRWMEYLCQQMILLKQITNVSISLFYDNRGSYLLDLVLRIPNLKRLRFDDISNWEIINYYQKENFNSIEKLYLNFYCYFEYIEKVLFYLPNLQILRLKLLRGNDHFNNNLSQILFNSLKNVHLTLCDTPFNIIISFLQTMPNISRIKIDGYIWGTNVIDYFQIEKWLKILSFLNKNIKEKRIYVDLDLRQDYSNLSTNNIGIINYSEFDRIGLQVTLYTIKGLIKVLEN